MFLAAKTFSVHRRVRNYYTKRILNLTLNQGKIFAAEKRGGNAANAPRTRRAAQEAFYNTFAGSVPTSLYTDLIKARIADIAVIRFQQTCLSLSKSSPLGNVGNHFLSLRIGESRQDHRRKT